MYSYSKVQHYSTLMCVCVCVCVCVCGLEEMRAGADPEVVSDVERWFGSLGSTVYTRMLSILGGVSWHIVCPALRGIEGVE